MRGKGGRRYYRPRDIDFIRGVKTLLHGKNFTIKKVKETIIKKGKEFMPFEERKVVLENINCVDKVIGFEDDDLGSCINALKLIKNMFPNDEIIFANGGDRNLENIPEMTEEGVQFLFGIGGNFKKNSSSSILDEWVDFIQKNKG